MHAACAIANYLARPKASRWISSYLLQVPHYTHSAVSPGLQAADLVAYLAARQVDTSVRPELKPWWDRFNELAWYQHGRTGSGAPRLRKTTGEVVGLRWYTRAGNRLTRNRRYPCGVPERRIEATHRIAAIYPVQSRGALGVSSPSPVE